MIPATSFAHRINRDGSIDSICKECFRTIASVMIVEELRFHERKHTCSGPAHTHTKPTLERYTTETSIYPPFWVRFRHSDGDEPSES